ncbi:MAG: glycosyltransferase family 39 protein, partial [Planctomycetota bacterium]
MPTDSLTGNKRGLDRWILVAFTVAAFLTRFYGIDRFPLFDDEVTSYFRGIHHDIYTTWPGTDLMIILFFKVFGTKAFFLRLPMALFGAASIPLFYALARRLFDRFTAVCGALLLLFSYYHLDHSQLTRYYAAIFFFGVLTLYFYLRFFESFDKKTLLWALLSTVGGVFFHPTFLGVPLSITVFAMLVLTLPRLKNKNEAGRRAAKLLILIFSLCLLVVVIIQFHLIRGWFYRSQSVEGGWGYDCFRLALQISKYFNIPLCLSTLAGILVMLRRDMYRGAFCGTLIIVPAGSLLAASFLMDMRPDYIFYIYPVFFLASARFVAFIREKTR